METDTKARRLRWAKPTPLVRRLIVTEADLILFEAIDRHGALPTPYLYEFTRHLRRDYTNLQHRLTEFYNGDQAGPYLTRPKRQFNAFEARYQPLVYGLAPRAERALGDRANRYAMPRSNDLVHDLMASCITASIELAAIAAGLAYVSAQEIIEQCAPSATRKASRPLGLPLSGKSLTPDGLFGLVYPDGGKRYFAVEADRNSESLATFGQKIENYQRILSERLYERHWGIPNLHVLTVTTNRRHMENLVLEVEKKQQPRWAKRFKFAVEPCFGTRFHSEDDGYWKVPREVLNHLLLDPWQTTVGPANINVV